MVICKELLNARNAQCESQAGYVFVHSLNLSVQKAKHKTRKSILRIGMIIYIIFGAQEAQIFAVFDTFEKSDEK